jgi:hydroxymethylpyrimidine kinase/phosphomethylpyrimidine kinase
MVGGTEIAAAVGKALALTSAPVVWDPVISPSRGDVRFVDRMFGDAVAALSPHLTLLTPNAQELAFLTGTTVSSVSDAITVGERLATQLGTAVLVKGGHLGGDESIDVLCHAPPAGGSEQLRGPRTPGGEHVHGTGCALSSVIAAHLAHGAGLVEACVAAKDFVTARIAAPVRPGRGAPAIV